METQHLISIEHPVGDYHWSRSKERQLTGTVALAEHCYEVFRDEFLESERARWVSTAGLVKGRRQTDVHTDVRTHLGDLLSGHLVRFTQVAEVWFA